MEEIIAQKMRCTSCTKTIFYYDAVGVHIKCRSCREIVTIPWEEIIKHSQEYVTFIHQTA